MIRILPVGKGADCSRWPPAKPSTDAPAISCDAASRRPSGESGIMPSPRVVTRPPMRRLLLILCLLFSLPALAARPEAPRAPLSLGGTLNNSSDFLPVDKAFRVELLESGPQQLRLRFSNADGYYLY